MNYIYQYVNKYLILLKKKKKINFDKESIKKFER